MVALRRPALDGLVRSQISSGYGKLNATELDQLWPDILPAVERPALSGEMFVTGVYLAGLELLSKDHFQAGI